MLGQSEGSHILLVEDHPGQLEILTSLLGEEGYHLVGCRTVAEALKYAQREPFDVVVVDLQVVDELGRQLLDLLKQRNGKIQIILNLAFASLSSAKENMDLGALAYLKEGGSSLEIMSHIHRVFRSHVTQYTEELEAVAAKGRAALEEREEHFQQLVEHINEVFWISTPDRSKVFFVSPLYESVWGRTCRSLLEDPLSLWDAIHPQDREYVLARVAPGDGTGFHGEFRIIRPDRSVGWVRARIFPIRNQQGEVLRMAGVAEDMTEQRRVEETLAKTERQFRQSSRMEAIGTLAGGIAHDFNNILTAILGYTELGLASVQRGSRTQRNLQEILTAGHRAKHLVQQILDFSRQSGQGKKPTPIHMVVREALKLLRATIPSTVEIHQLLKTESTILADPTQLHQVVVILCTNAEYAMRETGGILEITLQDVEVTNDLAQTVAGLQIGPHVRLTVQDSGTGMSSDVLERMFDPFFTTKPIGEGSGMGLAVAHGIITNYGGAIVVDSLGGKGTKIDVYLPTIPTQEWEALVEQGAIPVGKETILFVDDEETIVHLGKELLSQLGYTVEIQTSSLKALNIFRDDPQRFDLVITDQTMPGLTGEGLSRELLRIRPDLPIILCTGYSHIISAEKAKALGIQAYLMKPLAIRDLAPIVRHVLDKPLSPLAESRENL